MEWLTQPATWIALITLIALELVLGVDNIIFISILAGKLPLAQQARARTTGIALAVITRLLLLLSLSWIIQLTDPVLTVRGFSLSERDMILLVGGVFLIWKATHEIHEKLEGTEGHASAKVHASFWSVIVQIMLLDIVFSLDSVITAVGMVDELPIMIAAVIIAALAMIFLAAPLSAFVEGHPTIKILALSFLLLIGFTLVVEGLHVHIPKGYIYFAMGFSVMVEVLNLRLRQRPAEPIQLRSAYQAGELAPAMAASTAKPGSIKATPKKKAAKKRK
ncbi:MAG TPA: TerC family protein [Anaerolineales bacterium]|jgi:predicted tellurium resistance membrane protein TerC|nr:TerC family protein [Anaerolineales bacterium]HQX15911.1 TerC family protein [Anaerolineales bacterium]